MKIFVGGIRDVLTEQDIRDLFQNYGQLEAVMHKGNYCFVFMQSDDDARAACQALHRTEIRGCTLNVEESKPSNKGNKPITSEFSSRNEPFLADPNTPYRPSKFHHQPGRMKLIVGNIGSNTKDDLHNYFSQYGHVHESFILEEKGVGFVHVDDLKAEEMIDRCNGQELSGTSIRVSYSVSKDLKRPKSHMMRYTKLYVAPIAEEAKEEVLRQRFEMFGDIKEVVIIRKSKCAFVHIDSKVAEFAVNSLTNIPFYGKPLRPQLAKGEQFDRGDSQPFMNNMNSVSGPGMDEPGYFRGGPGASAPPPNWVQNGNSGYSQPVASQPPPQHESYPSHHPLANLELGPGFGPNAANTKMASLPPPPASQDELRELIEKRMKLEMIHPYEKHLIETYDGNSKNTPQMHPPPEYLRLVRDRAILKVRLLRAQERAFDVYGTATQMFTQGTQNANDPYGFESNNSSNNQPAESRSAALYDTQKQAQATIAAAAAAAATGTPNAGGEEMQYSEQAPAPSSSYATAYSNSMAAGGPMMKKEFVPRRAPY